MIEFSQIGLTAHFHPLLDDASLHIGSGEKAVLRGPSGCGKSSLLKCAVGAVPLTKGTVQIDGIELSAATVSQIRSRIAFIGQEPILGADRVYDAILLPFQFRAHAHNRPEQQQILELLDRLHLTAGILEKPCRHISGGEKQRIAILRALLLNKTVFFADEITSALDPQSKAMVMDALFRPKITLLSVSHDTDWIAACGRVVEMTDGKLEERP